MRAAPHPSLRRQLLVWLLAPQLVLWIAAAVVSYYVAVRHANLVIDQSLAQSSRALARQVKPFGDGLYIDFPAAAREILEEDPKDRLHYMVSAPPGQFLLGDRKLPAPPGGTPLYDTPLFYDGHMDGKPMRVAALYLHIGTPEHPQVMLVQVAKGTAVRSALAAEILTDTVTPLALLMLATSFVVWAGIARGLSPLRKLRRQVENRSPRDLAPLELDNAPTEVMALAHALNTLLSEVGKQVEKQKRFIADAAHQLRTPLAGLKSQTEVAQRELAEPVPDIDSLRQRLNRLEASADRGIRLVNQLLALARAEPDAPLTMAPLDLARLLRELAREVAPRAVARGLDLAVDGLDAPLLLSGNEGLLRELFANLLNNAVAYTPSGGEITLRLADQRHQAVVEVADTGPGIPLAERDAVFQRFYRGALQVNERGCGLGLPIAREIARRHGASIELLDNTPKGLRVRVTFPLTGS
jgi:two-component system sensor histidine kinase TctE